MKILESDHSCVTGIDQEYNNYCALLFTLPVHIPHTHTHRAVFKGGGGARGDSPYLVLFSPPALLLTKATELSLAQGDLVHSSQDCLQASNNVRCGGCGHGSIKLLPPGPPLAGEGSDERRT